MSASEGPDGRAREALQAVKADPTDKAALARLLIELWRSGHLRETNGAPAAGEESKRPAFIAFRLEGGLTTAERRKGMKHPWGARRKPNRRRNRHRKSEWSPGVWWTVGTPPEWWVTTRRESEGPWVVGLEDTGEVIAFHESYCKRFESISELVEWLGPRLREWRVWTRGERSPFLPPEKCAATLGPTRYPCLFDKGHKGQHCFLGRS